MCIFCLSFSLLSLLLSLLTLILSLLHLILSLFSLSYSLLSLLFLILILLSYLVLQFKVSLGNVECAPVISDGDEECRPLLLHLVYLVSDPAGVVVVVADHHVGGAHECLDLLLDHLHRQLEGLERVGCHDDRGQGTPVGALARGQLAVELIKLIVNLEEEKESIMFCDDDWRKHEDIMLCGGESHSRVV